jgi:DNA-binding CsgD family transcriptional regulator
MAIGCVRAGDVRLLLRLVGECSEVRHRGEQRIHLLNVLAQITGAQIGIEGTFEIHSPRAAPRIVDCSDVGWPSAGDRDRVYGYLASHPACDDPLNRGVLAQLATEPVATLSRGDVMTSADWERTEVRNDVHRPSGVDESLVSVMRTQVPTEVHVVVFKRGWGEPRFSEEDREILHLAHSECAWLFKRAPPAPVILGQDWTPRERETLRLLLTGASEKGIATILGLSTHTVHDYIKVVYRKAGVVSRPELMALAIGRPASRTA